MKEIYWVVYFSPMASKVGRSLESPASLGGRVWTRLQFPPPEPKGVAAAWSFNRRGEGVTSGKLVREMAGDAEGVGRLEFLVPSFTFPPLKELWLLQDICISTKKT